MSLENISFFASGNVNVQSFLSIVSGQPYYVTQATGSTPIVGIAQEGPVNAPGTPAQTNLYAATQGLELRVYGPGETALLICGGTINAGDYLTATTNGFGLTVPLTATGQSFVGAQALENGVSGVSIPVRVLTYTAGNV